MDQRTWSKMMLKYCKSYTIGQVRQYPDWSKLAHAAERQLVDDDLCYIWSDFTVTDSPLSGGNLLLQDAPLAWQQFCQSTLAFELPPELNDPRLAMTPPQ